MRKNAFIVILQHKHRHTCTHLFYVVSLKLFIYFYWGSFFTMVCQFLLYNKELNKLYEYIYPFPLRPPLYLHIPLIYAITELPVIYSRFPLAISFTHGTVYMSVLVSQFIPLVPKCLFSVSASLYLPCKQIRLYHCSRFHLHVLICVICVSLSDLLHSKFRAL